MGKKEKDKQIHKELEGFDVRINSFGQIENNLDIDKVNEFLNKRIEDKKLVQHKATPDEVDDESK